ncbi:hypothetical protein F4824DRAFT_467629 [Ustulina deusta]|nr:hypothetical protein F4824DRAFT_467629 [Ustulina deusta]
MIPLGLLFYLSLPLPNSLSIVVSREDPPIHLGCSHEELDHDLSIPISNLLQRAWSIAGVCLHALFKCVFPCIYN